MSSIWFEAAPDRRRHPALESAIDCDVVVIGGGIVGAMAAWRAAKEGAKVVLLERNRLAGGDTGYTTAMLTRVPDTHAAELKKKHGAAFLKRVFEATADAQREILSLIASEKIDCDLRACPTYFFAEKKGDEVLRAEWEAIKDADPRAVFLEDARAETGSPAMAEAIRFDGEARFHARKFVLGLLERMAADGRARVYEDTDAVSFAFGPDGVLVKTEKGEVRAARLVSATGLPSAAFKELQPLLTPRVSYVVGGALEAPKIVDANYWNTADPYDYFRYVDGGAFVFGGADRDGGAALELEEAKGLLRASIGRLGFKASIDRAWSGGLYFSADGLPYADAAPGKDRRAFVATGFGGNGMVMGALGGMIVGARAAGAEHPHADLFAFSRTGADLKPASAEPVKFPVLRWLLPLAYLAVLAAPAAVFFSRRGGFDFFEGLDAKTFRLLAFPLVGLYAFTLVWAQAMLGSCMPYLRRMFPRIETFHRAQGAFALLFALTHPVFLVTGLGFSEYVKLEFVDPRYRPFVLLGDLQLLVLMTTVGTALLMKLKWLRTRWQLIHLANYAVFAMVWIHSWFLGSDVRPSALRWLWIFFAVTFVAAAALRVRRAKPRAAPADGARWIDAAKSSDVVEGEAYCATVDGREIALFRVGGRFHALDNACSHAGGPLCRGPLKGTEIECPWHQSRFDVATGAPVKGPATRPQPRYEAREAGGKVQVKL